MDINNNKMPVRVNVKKNMNYSKILYFKDNKDGDSQCKS